MTMDSLAENSIEHRTLASSTSGQFLSTSRGRAEAGHAQPENSRSALSCYPVMHRSYAGRSHNALQLQTAYARVFFGYAVELPI
jgi:hypothetical protein